jgi:hypothetical protein
VNVSARSVALGVGIPANAVGNESLLRRDVPPAGLPLTDRPLTDRPLTVAVRLGALPLQGFPLTESSRRVESSRRADRLPSLAVRNNTGTQKTERARKVPSLRSSTPSHGTSGPSRPAPEAASSRPRS